MLGDVELQDIIEQPIDESINLYTIYINAKDYPNDVVVRIFNIRKGSIIRTEKIKKFKTIDECKSYFTDYGLVFMKRFNDDDVSIYGNFI